MENKTKLTKKPSYYYSAKTVSSLKIFYLVHNCDNFSHQS